MKKKYIMFFLISTVYIARVFSNEDYNRGYMEGYLACQNGEENKIVVSINKDLANQLVFGAWSYTYIDKNFGSFEIDDSYSYICTDVLKNATFSNKVVNDSKLSAMLVIEKKSVAIILLENGTDIVSGSSDNPRMYNILINCDSKAYKFHASNNEGRLWLNDSEYQNFINILQKEKPITINITETTYNTSSFYSVNNIDTTGFNSAYKKLISK